MRRFAIYDQNDLLSEREEFTTFFDSSKSSGLDSPLSFNNSKNMFESDHDLLLLREWELFKGRKKYNLKNENEKRREEKNDRLCIIINSIA